MDKWPKKVIVGSVTYNVEYTPHRDAVDDDGNNYNVCGQVHYRKHRIRIWIGQGDEAQEPIEQLDTLLHELLHVVFAQNPAMKKLLTEDAEETFVTCLGRALSDTLTRSEIVSLPAENTNPKGTNHE